jgi:hypothetical protein
VAGKQNQFKPVVDLVDAVFDSHPSHSISPISIVVPTDRLRFRQKQVFQCAAPKIGQRLASTFNFDTGPRQNHSYMDNHESLPKSDSDRPAAEAV